MHNNPTYEIYSTLVDRTNKKEGMDRTKTILIAYQRDIKNNVLFIGLMINLEFFT